MNWYGIKINDKKRNSIDFNIAYLLGMEKKTII